MIELLEECPSSLKLMYEGFELAQLYEVSSRPDRVTLKAFEDAAPSPPFVQTVLRLAPVVLVRGRLHKRTGSRSADVSFTQASLCSLDGR